MLYTHIRNYGCRLNTNLFYKSLRIAVLENELLRISVLIDKGTDIFEFLYKPKDMDFMWLSPCGINNPSKFVPTTALKNGNYMDYYEGGWQEILPNFGDGVVYNGVELGLHGEISLIPWDYQVLENNPSKISIKFTVRTYRTPFYLEKILTLNSGDPKLYIEESLKNEGYVDIECMWAHHPTFGGLFMDGDVVLDIPANKVKYILRPENEGKYDEIKDNENIKWPMFKGYCNKEIDFSKPPSSDDGNQMIDEVCLGSLKDSWYAVTNLNKKSGFGIRWDKKIFPYIWIWRMYGKGSKMPPSWGRINCMAVEFCSSYSPIGLNEAVKNKTAIKLKPLEEIKTAFFAVAYDKDGNVNLIDGDGKIL